MSLRPVMAALHRSDVFTGPELLLAVKRLTEIQQKKKKKKSSSGHLMAEDLQTRLSLSYQLFMSL